MHEAIDNRTPLTVLLEQEAGWDDESQREELCMNAVIRLADFAMDNPGAWQTGKIWLRNPGASQSKISRLAGVTQATVSRHIRTIREVIADKKPGGQYENAAIGSKDFY